MISCLLSHVSSLLSSIFCILSTVFCFLSSIYCLVCLQFTIRIYPVFIRFKGIIWASIRFLMISTGFWKCQSGFVSNGTEYLKCYSFYTERNYSFSYKFLFGRIIRIRSKPTCTSPGLEKSLWSFSLPFHMLSLHLLSVSHWPAIDHISGVCFFPLGLVYLCLSLLQ